MAHILLVDDNPSVRTLYQVILENSGHQVTNAENGVQALDFFKSNTYDLIITDLLMPEMNGTEFIFEIKKQIPEMPIIAVSAGDPNPEDEILSFILTAETVKHIKKPFKPDRLTEVIDKLLP